MNNFTHKQTYEFSFDDLRLYVKLKDTEIGMLSQDVLDCTFEIQIKTFLQHAWTIATHDLIYKSPQINWGKERIAYQVKASLEQAEITISNIEKIYSCEELNKNNKETKRINKLISFLEKYWNADKLPNDRRRLAQNIDNAIKILDLNIEELIILLEKENSEGRGSNTLNLSPFLIIIQSICNQYPQKIIDNYNNNKQKLFLTSDIDLTKVNALSKEQLETFT